MIDKESYKRVSDQVYQEGKEVSKTMFKYPTANERKLADILSRYNVKFTFQKLLFSHPNGIREYLDSYYVAQFWLHRKKLFLEVEPGYRLVKPKYTGFRTFKALDVFPKAQCIKLTEEDLNTPEFVSEFLKLIK